jgi:hypothetical protein
MDWSARVVRYVCDVESDVTLSLARCLRSVTVSVAPVFAFRS